jgi:hypothetical protein
MPSSSKLTPEQKAILDKAKALHDADTRKDKPDYGQMSVDALNRAVLKEEEELKNDGRALCDGSYPVDNKNDLTFAIPRIDYAPDRAMAKAYIEARAKSLGLWDERMDGSWWRGDTKN